MAWWRQHLSPACLATGTVSAYMSVCHNLHVPKDTDVVFVEYRWVAISEDVWLLVLRKTNPSAKGDQRVVWELRCFHTTLGS